MCSVLGYYSRNIKKSDFLESLHSTVHRGPDNQNYWIDNNVGLGHNRLSIIDLSSDANQPMFSTCDRYIIVYNGEVYNFKFLANKYNINAKTNSDTEIVLKLFIKKGVDFVNELNGMFAIIIFDKVENQFFLFRDRLGIKPLYYYYDNDNFAFSSEIKALHKLNFFDNKFIFLK